MTLCTSFHMFRPFCPECKDRLFSEALTTKEFEEIRDSFFDVSFKRQDIFHSTTPEEMQAFQDFLHQNGPFDVVVDGLNASHIVRKDSIQHRGEHVRFTGWEFSQLLKSFKIDLL